jgi:hypothetical protein
MKQHTASGSQAPIQTPASGAESSRSVRTPISSVARAPHGRPLGWAGQVRTLAIIAAAFASTACGNIEPWVKPYERQALADTIMSFDANPVSSAYIHHVYEAREGARGALGGGGGGCGCN